ncbi:LysR family transcriptional regulator [Vibrio sp. VPAP30]|uniref:LysR family transcriptional regulator n=1 Tax=Vibrio sp. VPAP30 TaxID=1647102 RepID=UPI0006599A65|nr:LysR family transcriptional regulator [Vibrio sp. VPAP30]KLN63557.1 LysR family transcriptional regulator [Vibrio sp. VPAP30]
MKSDLHRMQVFVQIVESGSITKASDQLDVSKSVVSHHLQALEHHLNVKLITRTTRRQSLTEAGQRFYQRCLELNKLMSLAEEEARSANADLAGTITITSPHTLMNQLIGPAICDFVRLNPQIEPQLIANDMRLNLIEKYIDLSVTVGELPDSSARAFKLGELEQVLCCSPDYIAQKDLSLPLSKSDLANCDYIANQWEGTNVERKFDTSNTNSISYRFRANRIGDSVPTIKLMALSGLGIACLPKLAIGEELRQQKLVQVTGEQVKLIAPVWVVHNYGLQMPSRIRAFIDFLKLISKDKL